MIKNELQHRLTLRELGRFEEALAEINDSPDDLDPQARQLFIDAYSVQIEVLRQQEGEYEARIARPAALTSTDG